MVIFILKIARASLVINIITASLNYYFSFLRCKQYWALPKFEENLSFLAPTVYNLFIMIEDMNSALSRGKAFGGGAFPGEILIDIR